jgi:hypothetical protein
MRTSVRSLGPLSMAFILAMTQGACKRDTEEAGVTSGGSGAARGVDDTTEMSFSLGGPSLPFYIHNASDTTNWTTTCAIKSNASTKDISCLVEGHELDLVFFGNTLVYNVPPNMCYYANFMPYAYYFNEPGTGPTTLAYDIDSKGKKGLDTNNDGTIDTLASAGGYTTNNAAAVKVVGGFPTCKYSYASDDPAGPNCCEGAYDLSVRSWSGTAYETTDSHLKWGGSWANCLTGPAMDSQTKDRRGFPMSNLIYLNGNALNKEYSTLKTSEKERVSALHTSNYYDPADHGGGFPTAAWWPYYELLCLDRAKEVKARIRLMIREWNLMSELDKKGSGNPDTTGNETDFPTYPNNDYRDWKDLGNSWPYPAGYHEL